MTLLVDADAVSKLAHWALLEELPVLTGVPLADCATLDSVIHRSRRAAAGERDRLFRSVDVAKGAVAALKRMSPPIQPETAVLARFQDIAGIDAGEAVLLSVMQGKPSAVLLTGDKRALRTLAVLPEKTRRNFSGRILVIEQVVLAALKVGGIEWLRQHLCAFRDVDTAVSIVLGSRCDAPEAAVREGLESYIGELAKLSDPSLLIDR